MNLVDCYAFLKQQFPNETFHSLSGKNISTIVLNFLKKQELDLKFLVGISTDGASAMTSARCGAVKFIKDSAPNASHTICMNHALNLGVNVGLKHVVFDDVFRAMNDVYNFFR